MLRALVIATVVMGVMIVLGTAVVVVGVVQRLHGGPTTSNPLVLDEPAGTRIAGMTATGDRLAVRLQGGGPDRIVLIDVRSALVTSRVALAQ